MHFDGPGTPPPCEKAQGIWTLQLHLKRSNIAGCVEPRKKGMAGGRGVEMMMHMLTAPSQCSHWWGLYHTLAGVCQTTSDPALC